MFTLNKKKFNYHIPIFVTRILTYIDEYISFPIKDFWIIDGTLGDAGHTLAFLSKYSNCRVLAFDRDEQMLKRSCMRLKEAGFLVSSDLNDLNNHANNCIQVFLINENYAKAFQIAQQACIAPHVILIDAGVSMFHFRKANRGFSYTDDSLDMRLDFPFNTSKNKSEPTAYDVINDYNKEDLLRILQQYGEQRFAKRIVDSIIRNRPIEHAHKLADIVLQAVPFSKPGKHPATTVFQALRIFINKELESLEASIDNLPKILQGGGLFLVISFHSLEDRVVKHGFKKIGHKKRASNKGRKSKYKQSKLSEKDFLILTSTPEQVSTFEKDWNPASRSAKLRVLQKSLGK